MYNEFTLLTTLDHSDYFALKTPSAIYFFFVLFFSFNRLWRTRLLVNKTDSFNWFELFSRNSFHWIVSSLSPTINQSRNAPNKHVSNWQLLARFPKLTMNYLEPIESLIFDVSRWCDGKRLFSVQRPGNTNGFLTLAEKLSKED